MKRLLRFVFRYSRNARARRIRKIKMLSLSQINYAMECAMDLGELVDGDLIREAQKKQKKLARIENYSRLERGAAMIP